MRPLEFNFFLDVTFKKGTNVTEVKAKRTEGKNVDSHYNPNATAIYLGCTVNGTFVKANIGFKIKPAEWDFDSQKPLRKFENYLQLSAYVSKIKSKAESEYLLLLTNESKVNPSAIKELLMKAIRLDKPVIARKTFWEVYAEFEADKKMNTKSSTMEKYNATKKALVAFEKKNYRLAFDEINMKFYDDFRTFSALNLGHLNNTISKSLRNIKTFLAWATDHPNKYNTVMEYKRFKGDNDQPEVIFLTSNELERFRKHDTGVNEGLSLSKDKFVFQCYTGQRIGDILKLKKQDIRTTENGLEWVLYQQKGNKKYPIQIPILEAAEEILNRHRNIKDGYDTVFKRQDKITHLDNIKAIAKAVGIDTPTPKVNYRLKKRVEVTKPKHDFIGTHTARKTFISICLEKGIRPEQIMTISGHTSVKQMLPYIGTDKNKFVNDLKEKWNKNETNHPNEDKGDQPTISPDNN